MSAPRNHLIDLLRFIAASWVALYHLNEPILFQDNFYRKFIKLGHLGVPIFFVISGYCIMLAAQHAVSAKDFMIKRFFRIYPAFWFSLAIVAFTIFISIICIGSNSVTVLPKGFWSIIASLTLLTKPFSKIDTVNWVYWSLTYEIFFYIIIYVYLLISTKLRFSWLMLITGLTFFLPKHDSWFFFFIQHWPAFLIGISIYKIHTAMRTSHKVEGVFFLLAAIIGLFYNPGGISLYYQLTCILTGTLILLNEYWTLKENLFSKFGDYSYAIYLIHVPIGVYIFGLIRETLNFPQNLLLNICWDLITYGMIMIIARWIFLKLEKPFILIGKKLSNRFFIKNYNFEKR